MRKTDSKQPTIAVNNFAIEFECIEVYRAFIRNVCLSFIKFIKTHVMRNDLVRERMDSTSSLSTRAIVSPCSQVIRG